MSNSYFQFKQFRVEQSQCAMKVSTDACIQGAWTPIENSVKTVLDIGTGTGLLSLMLAQRNKDIVIDAIEIDENAVKQAQTNFKESLWSNRLNIIQGDAKTHIFRNEYDLIICNPPFFKNSLLSGDEKRNYARHDIHFSLENLLQVLDENLSKDGYASVLLPIADHKRWEETLQSSRFNITHLLAIKPTLSKQANRILSVLKQSKENTHFHELLIRENGQEYSPDFKNLLKDYYLHF